MLPCSSFFLSNTIFYSAIAQLVERATVNRVVAGSSPACGVFICKYLAALAQQVERIHGKDEVAGSNPASGFDKQRLRTLFFCA